MKLSKLFNVLCDKIEELQESSGYEYLGLRCDKRDFELGEILDFKSVSAQNNDKKLIGVSSVDANFYESEEIDFIVKSFLSFYPFFVKNMYDTEIENIYILGSNKINTNKNFLDENKKDFFEIRMIKPEVLFKIQIDFDVDEYIKYFDVDMDLVKKYILDFLLKDCINVYKIKLINKKDFEKTLKIIHKERENDTSTRKSIVKTIFHIREIIGENKIKNYQKETGNNFCDEGIYDDVLSFAMEKYYGEKEYYKKIEAGEIDVDNMVFRDFDPLFW